MTTFELARAVHEIHRAIAYAQNDPFPNGPFDSLTAEKQQPTMNMVHLIRRGATREQVQDAWLEYMRRQMPGIRWGAVKDLNASPPTHPGYLPWSKLGKWDRRKVEAGYCIVEKLTGKS